MKKLTNYLRLTAVACTLCFVMTGCGRNDRNTTTGNNKNKNTTENSVANNVGNAAEDVAEGVGNAVDDLVGGKGFNNYNEAHKHFMNTMGSYHSDAKFELRNEDQNLMDYQEGSKGYRFNLYDTSKNAEGEHFGEFYVDAATGKIYRKGENNAFEEYTGKTGTSSATDMNKNGKTANNGTTNNGNGGGTGTNGTNTNGAVTGRQHLA